MNKEITPMSKVSSEMKTLRNKFTNLGFKHIGLNKCDEKITEYSDFMKNYDMRSYESKRGAVKSDRTELFETIIPDLVKNCDTKIVVGVSFNYTGEEKEKVITLSLTEHLVRKESSKENKLMTKALFFEPMNVPEFKKKINEFMSELSSDSFNKLNLKDWFIKNGASLEFEEKDSRVRKIKK